VESSIEEPVMRDTTLQHPNRDQVTFQLVEEGSKRRKTKPVDSLGYSYKRNCLTAGNSIRTARKTLLNYSDTAPT